MAKATSTSESSLSSALADALTRIVGIPSGVSDQHVMPAIRQKVAKTFTDRVRKEAGTPELWGSSAKSIDVTIGPDDRVSVSPSGTPEEVREAEMLEYGTPDVPPRAVMRTYEASFNEEYKVMMNGYSV